MRDPGEPKVATIAANIMELAPHTRLRLLVAPHSAAALRVSPYTPRPIDGAPSA